MNDYQGRERRAAHPLSDEQMEAIAERAAEKALQKVYAEVGRNLVHKLLWFIGVAAIGLLMWMNGKGIKLP